MKVLIWIGCMLVVGLVQALFKSNGILLGFLPTFILMAAAIACARALSKKWDERDSK